MQTVFFKDTAEQPGRDSAACNITCFFILCDAAGDVYTLHSICTRILAAQKHNTVLIIYVHMQAEKRLVLVCVI